MPPLPPHANENVVAGSPHLKRKYEEIEAIAAAECAALGFVQVANSALRPIGSRRGIDLLAAAAAPAREPVDPCNGCPPSCCTVSMHGEIGQREAEDPYGFDPTPGPVGSGCGLCAAPE